MPNPNIAQDSPATFKPGQTGNPNGRPKKEWTWAGLYEEAVEEKDETGEPIKKIIAKKLARMAKNGDIAAIKELTNRTDGMPKQSTDITTDGEKLNPLIIIKDGSTSV